MKFVKSIVRFILKLLFGTKKSIVMTDVSDIPMVEKTLEPVGVRTIHIIDLCYVLIRPNLQREISKATVASIMEFSVLPRYLVNPLSWIVAVDAAYRFGMHHEYFPNRELFPRNNEQRDFIAPYMANSGIDKDIINMYSSMLRKYNGYNIIMPKDIVELDGVRRGYLGNLPNVSVPKELNTSRLVSPVDPETNRIFVNGWAKSLGQAEKYPDNYGSLSGKFHSGWDLNLPLDRDAGHPVYAVADGIVTNSVYQRNGLGNTVRYRILYKGQEIFIRCAHLKDRWCKHGDVIKAGDAIGTIGNSTGNRVKYANHLHFDVQKKNTDVYEKTGFITVEDLFRKFINLKELYPYG